MDNQNDSQRPARIRGRQLYDFRIVEADDLTGYQDAIWDMYKRKYDGILVRNALSHADCDHIIASGRSLDPRIVTQMPVGWTFPAIFAALVGKAFAQGEAAGQQAMAAYFQTCEDFNKHAAQSLGLDTTAIVEQWLGAFGGGRTVGVPAGYDGKGQYTGTTLRGYKGNGEGNISIHCGNYFQTSWQKFYEHLEQDVDVYDQLSYFFMLQQPESGGELSLYDLEWEKGQSKKSNHENAEVILADGSIRNIEQDEVQYIDPRKGDMILFAGGQIWHRVEQVMGQLERITLGGFLAFSYDKSHIHYWS